MQISYGPPAAHGVTQLMAVGSADLETSPSDRVVRWGTLISVAVAGYGVATGRKGARNAGLGAAVALVAVGVATGAFGGGAVPVTTPAPADGFIYGPGPAGPGW